ncbi:hypothetical protein [Streptomyces sp. NPDC017993]|uniref:hypothetical protein n=1 Tax=Streptomyces sp. NPDC017993 TaxID=3365027 RepID=UPI00378D2298
MVDQGLWREDAAFGQPGALRRTIDGAGRFPWIENPQAVRAAFADLTELLKGEAR